MRATQTHFMVTVGAVIRDGSGRILLVDHAFRAGNAWGIPGGFVNCGEQPLEAIRREMREEIMLEIEGVELACVRTIPNQNQLEIIFVCRPVGVPQPDGVEIRAAAWFSVEELPHKLNAIQCLLVERALASVARDGQGSK
jgi:ADP-ribose pyrophosphatase YjhB (NUDIX family)